MDNVKKLAVAVRQESKMLKILRKEVDQHNCVWNYSTMQLYGTSAFWKLVQFQFSRLKKK